MYDSGVTMEALAAMLQSEVDIADDISEESIYRWVSSLEQLLYSDVIRCYRAATVTLSEHSFLLSDIAVRDGERAVTFDDVAKIYVGTTELARCSVIGAYQFESDKPLYYEDGDRVYIRYFSDAPYEATVIYTVRPSTEKTASSTVCLPYEWLDMVLAKVKGEAYKVAGDDAQAAKWLGDFNAQNESFRLWASERQKRFGE